MHYKYFGIQFCFGCVFAALSISSTFGQSLLTPGDREFLRNRQQRLLEEQRKKLEELQQFPDTVSPRPQPVPPETTKCVEVVRIVLEGVSPPLESDLREQIAPFEGRCLDQMALDEILRRVTTFYVTRGEVTTRAYIPEQDVVDGILTIRVTEGVLERLESEDGLPSGRELSMTFPGRAEGQRLNLRTLEQMVDQLARLPSRQVTLDIAPGLLVGSSQVRVKRVPEKPWRLRVSHDNNGEKVTGRRQIRAVFEWDSPLGLADQVSIYGGRDLEGRYWSHSAHQGLSYSLPFGWWTFNYSHSQSYYRTRTQAAGFDFVSDGKTKNQQLRAERLLYRGATSKTSASVSVVRMETRNYLENTLIDVSSPIISEVRFGLNHGRRIGNGFVNLDTGVQRGVSWWGAERRPGIKGAPDPRYTVYSLTASYLRPLLVGGEAFNLESMLVGQKSEDALFGMQRLTIGGLYSVRGFREQSLSGDSGMYWRNHLRWRHPVGRIFPVMDSVGVGLGYDVGVISNNRHVDGFHGRLRGASLELLADSRYFSARIIFSRALERPAIMRREASPVYFSLNLSY